MGRGGGEGDGGEAGAAAEGRPGAAREREGARDGVARVAVELGVV